MSSSAGPIEGPCVAWITGDDVISCGAPEPESSDERQALDLFAVEASMVLFELSGRKYTGGCRQTVRPCRPTCSCWGQWTGGAAGVAAWYWAPWQGTFSWQDGCGGSCGCGSTSRVLLAGYPVTEIVEVMIGDEVLPETDPDTAKPNWRLDGYKWLTRLDYIDDQGVAQPRRWPGCQNTSLPDGEPGTWAVTYDYGVMPPLAGLEAAKQLALELYRACNGLDCQLPQGAVRVQRQGITIERVLLTWEANTTARGVKSGGWTTGLSLVDTFLSTYNPYGLRRRPAIASPDLPEYAQKLGS